MSTGALVLAALAALSSDSEPPGQPRLLVLDFGVSDGIDGALVDVATDTYISTLKEIDRFDLATSSDVRMMLNTEEQKQLVGCDDDSCMAEVAGALGAQYLSRGRLSLLDEEIILTLELFDTGAASLENQLTAALPADVSTVDDKVRAMTFSLLRVKPPEAWYENEWLWVGAGAAVLGAGVAIYFATRGDDGGEPNLGRFVLDG